MAEKTYREQSAPAVRFLSLFVDDLAAARARFERLLGVGPNGAAAHAPAPHPFAAEGPIVFSLDGGVELALYQCHPSRGTHAGDVGIGLEVADAKDVAARARASSFQIFFGPAEIDADGRAMAGARSPDGHFFELVETGRR